MLPLMLTTHHASTLHLVSFKIRVLKMTTDESVPSSMVMTTQLDDLSKQDLILLITYLEKLRFGQTVSLALHPYVPQWVRFWVSQSGWPTEFGKRFKRVARRVTPGKYHTHDPLRRNLQQKVRPRGFSLLPDKKPQSEKTVLRYIYTQCFLFLVTLLIILVILYSYPR